MEHDLHVAKPALTLSAHGHIAAHYWPIFGDERHRQTARARNAFDLAQGTRLRGAPLTAG
jgi:hypothetical protein